MMLTVAGTAPPSNDLEWKELSEPQLRALVVLGVTTQEEWESEEPASKFASKPPLESLDQRVYF